MNAFSEDGLWIYGITFREDEDDPEIEIKQYGDSESMCCDCGLKYPARIDYPSGNTFYHEYLTEENKCSTLRIPGGSNE